MEKQVEQEAAYPIPISLYNCYRTVRHEKRYISGVASYASLLMPHCPATVVQRYRDGVCSLLFHLFFIICHPYIPLHLEEMIFYTCIIIYLLDFTILRRLYRKSLQFHVHRVSRMRKYIPFALCIRAHGTTAAGSLRGIGLRFMGYTAVLCTTAVH